MLDDKTIIDNNLEYHSYETGGSIDENEDLFFMPNDFKGKSKASDILVLKFDNGIIGNRIENTIDFLSYLSYTQHIPQYKITLWLSIWGNTTISYQLGFLHSGDNDSKYGYVIKTISKGGWDYQSVEWFYSLIIEAFKNLQVVSDKPIKNSAFGQPLKEGTILTIKTNKDILLPTLINLAHNFLDYKSKSDGRNKYTKISVDEIIKMINK